MESISKDGNFPWSLIKKIHFDGKIFHSAQHNESMQLHYFCAHCGELWFHLETQNKLHYAITRDCPKHGNGSILFAHYAHSFDIVQMMRENPELLRHELDCASKIISNSDISFVR